MASAPHDLHKPLEPGVVIQGEYRVERLLGEGGYGAVYAATQLNLGRKVALKVLHPDVVARGAARERFRREAQLAQSLSHPNTVRLFDFGETDGRPFIIYEYLEGQPLDAVLAREGPFSPQRTARVASQTLKALMEAHAKGIVHRDIKPGNIFICNFDGEPDFVKVLDFGIASAGDAMRGPTLTGEGMTVGTPAYMAPEQALASDLDGRADMYSVGLVMAELLSGKQVYGGESLMRIVMAQASPDRPPLPDEAIHSPLGPVIQRATAKNRDLRFPNGRAMLDMIESVVARLGPTGSGQPSAVAGYGPSPHASQLAPPLDPRYAATGYAMPSASSSSFANVHQTGGAAPSGHAPAQPAYAPQGYGAPPTAVPMQYPPGPAQAPFGPAAAAPPTTLGGASAPVAAVGAPSKKRSSALVFAIGFLACAAVAAAVFGIWYALTPVESTKPTPKGAKTASAPVIIVQKSDKKTTDDDFPDPEIPDFQIPDIHNMMGMPGMGGMNTDPAATAFFKFYGKDATATVAKLETLGVRCMYTATMDVLGPLATYMCSEKGNADFVMQLKCKNSEKMSAPCTTGICTVDEASGCGVNMLVDAAHTQRAKDLQAQLK